MFIHFTCVWRNGVETDEYMEEGYTMSSVRMLLGAKYFRPGTSLTVRANGREPGIYELLGDVLPPGLRTLTVLEDCPIEPQSPTPTQPQEDSVLRHRAQASRQTEETPVARTTARSSHLRTASAESDDSAEYFVAEERQFHRPLFQEVDERPELSPQTGLETRGSEVTNEEDPAGPAASVPVDRTLNVEVAPGITLSVKAPELAEDGSSVTIPEDALRALRQLGLDSVPLTPVEAAREFARPVWGLPYGVQAWRQELMMLIFTNILTAVGHMNSNYWTYPALVVYIGSAVAFTAIVICIITQTRPRLVERLGLPDVYSDESPEVIAERIPITAYAYIDDTERVVRELRMQPSWRQHVAVAIAGLLPPVYNEWQGKLTARKDKHERAVALVKDRIREQPANDS